VITLYHTPDWASTIIRLALEEAGEAYDIVLLDARAGDLDQPEFRAVNPLGLIPAVTTPDGPIFETAAILLWLVDRHPRLGPQAGSPDRAAFLAWLAFVSNTLHQTVMAMLHPYRPAGAAAAAEVQRLARERLNEQAAHLDRLAASAPRFLSTEPGILGHYIGVLLRWTIMLPPDERFDLAPHPHLRAVLAAHEASAAAQRVAALDGLGPTPYTQPET